MAFISTAEFSTTISTDIISLLSGGDDGLVDYIVDQNVELMKTYLRAKYSADTIFSTTGDNRNILLRKYCADLSVYDLYSLCTGIRQIPALRIKRYNDAILWLQQVQSEAINPYLYGSGVTGYTVFIRSGSNIKRQNYED
jgi:phage gp36-like protein